MKALAVLRKAGLAPTEGWVLEPHRIRDLDETMKVNAELRDLIEPVAGSELANKATELVANAFGPIVDGGEAVRA